MSSLSRARLGPRRVVLAETLERRCMFDGSAVPPPAAAPGSVPVLSPFVIEAGFSCEQAPHQVRVKFSEDVWASLDGSDLTLIHESGRFIVPGEMLTVNWDAETNTATFVIARFNDGMLPDGRWHATLHGDGIANAQGIALDGDDDQFPGGNFGHDFFFLSGDADRDGTVGLVDLNRVVQNFGQTGRPFSQGDLNYDGLVDLADFQIVASQFGVQIDNTPPHVAGGGSGEPGGPGCTLPVFNTTASFDFDIVDAVEDAATTR